MRFSEESNYRAYAVHLCADNYPAARSALEACMANPSIVPAQKSFLLQTIGNTYFLEGNLEQALHYMTLGERADDTSLFFYQSAADFFVHWKDYPRAIAKCDEIIAKATSSPFTETEKDRSSDYYIAKAEELKQFCLSQKTEE